MDTFSTAYVVTAAIIAGTLWALVIADSIGDTIRRAAHKLGRAITRVFTRHPQKD